MLTVTRKKWNVFRPQRPVRKKEPAQSVFTGAAEVAPEVQQYLEFIADKDLSAALPSPPVGRKVAKKRAARRK